MEEEIWRPIPDTDGQYEASTLGRFRSVDRVIVDKNGFKRSKKGLIMKMCNQDNGYLTATITYKGKRGKVLAHRLVAITFIETDDYSLQVLHIDNDKKNNKVSNLKWGTQKQNVADAFKDGLNTLGWEHNFATRSMGTYMQMFFLHNIGVKVAHIARMLDLPNSTVWNAIENYEKHKDAFHKIFLECNPS